MDVKIKKLRDSAKIPTRGSEYAAGYDLYACIDEPIDIPPKEMRKIPVGVAMQLPHGYFGGIYARSGLAYKKGIRPCNCTGVIDCDYNAEIVAGMYNDSNEIQTIEPNDRVAQMIIQPYLTVGFEEVRELPETRRGGSGFGSSGR